LRALRPAVAGRRARVFRGRDFSRSSQTIGAAGEEFEATHVAEDLKLLANFIADVAIDKTIFGLWKAF
jgi:hypothetical protein